MEAFIRSDQYNFIKSQAYILANGHATANDRGVIQALKSLAIEKDNTCIWEFNGWTERVNWYGINSSK